MNDAEVDQLINQIRVAMDVEDLTNAQVARMSGFSEGYISQLLNRSRLDRKRNPGPVLVIAHAMGLVRIVESRD
jgi:hypothetical protein